MCAPGDAWKLIEQGATKIEGDMPFNPSGGVLATNPVVATSINRVIEAALQLRGDAGEHQVSHKRLERAIATAFGAVGEDTIISLRKSL